MPQAGDCVVVQVAMRNLKVIRQRLFVNGETVVLSRDLDAAGLRVQNGLVGAPVPELELKCLGTGS